MALCVIAIVALGPGLAAAIGSIRVLALPPLAGIGGALGVLVIGAGAALLALAFSIVGAVLHVPRSLPLLTLGATLLLTPAFAYGGISVGVSHARTQAVEDAQRIIGANDLADYAEQATAALSEFGVDGLFDISEVLDQEAFDLDRN